MPSTIFVKNLMSYVQVDSEYPTADSKPLLTSQKAKQLTYSLIKLLLVPS